MRSQISKYQVEKKYQENWVNGLNQMRTLFGAESIEYQRFLCLAIKELLEFRDHYAKARHENCAINMHHARHKIRVTLSFFGGEFWCDRLKNGTFIEQEVDLLRMHEWLTALTSFLETEQKKICVTVS
ncbi:MAG: hypothetical protein AAF740_01415 [Bacteroidota bacterium]